VVVAEQQVGHPAQLVDPHYEDLLRLFGAICAIPSVGRIGLGHGGATVMLWVQLTEDDERAEHQIYDAEGHYLATKATPSVELRVIFADEGESAFPSSVPMIFSRP